MNHRFTFYRHISSQSNNNQPINATTKNQPFAYVISWKSKANQPKKIFNTNSLYIVGSHEKNQQLLSKNEKTPKMSVQTFLPRAFPLITKKHMSLV